MIKEGKGKGRAGRGGKKNLKTRTSVIQSERALSSRNIRLTAILLPCQEAR